MMLALTDSITRISYSQNKIYLILRHDDMNNHNIHNVST